MKKSLLSALSLSVAAGVLLAPSSSAAADAPVGADAPRGAVVRATELVSLPSAAVRRKLREGGFDASQVRRGVTSYRIVYSTIDEYGDPTVASGVLALPRTGPTVGTVVYEHGTSTYRPEVASSWRDKYTFAPTLVYASAGFATVAPDYLGLGKGTGPHPWMHIASEVSASADLLTAAATFLDERGGELDRTTYVTGFSQGASAALGLTRELQKDDSGWEVRATAPIGGAFAFRDAEIPALLDGRLHPIYSVAYTALLLTTYDRLFGLYDHPREVVRPPYAGRLARLFDGSTPGPEMIASLPTSIDDLLTPAGRRLLRHPSPALSRGLRQADAVCRWAPETPVRLMVAQGDEQAHSSNTTVCAERLGERSSLVQVRRLGRPELFGSRHIGSNVEGTARALRWFSRLAGVAAK